MPSVRIYDARVRDNAPHSVGGGECGGDAYYNEAKTSNNFLDKILEFISSPIIENNIIESMLF